MSPCSLSVLSSRLSSMKVFVSLTGLILVVLVLVSIQHIYTKNGEHVGNTASSSTVATAPAFVLPDEEGKAVTFADIRGDVSIIHFWASWSPDSGSDLVALSQIVEEYGDTIGVVAVNRDHERQDGLAFLEQLGVSDTIEFVYDAEDTYFRKVGGYNMPETVFVGKEEEVLLHVHGAMGYDSMKQHVEKLLQ